MSKVITVASDSPTHDVVIYDETAKVLADIFLPPEGSRVSSEELEACVRRLMATTEILEAIFPDQTNRREAAVRLVKQLRSEAEAQRLEVQ